MFLQKDFRVVVLAASLIQPDIVPKRIAYFGVGKFREGPAVACVGVAIKDNRLRSVVQLVPALVKIPNGIGRP